MRFILYDGPSEKRANFHPLSLSRPIWELRCGMGSLAEKLIAKVGAGDAACFVEPYMADSYRAKTSMKVNDPATLSGDDLFIVNGRVKAGSFNVSPKGPSEIGVTDDGEVLYARIAKADADRLQGACCLGGLLESAKSSIKTVQANLPVWNYTWDLVLANPGQLVEDFKSAGRSGIEGVVEQPNAIRGSEKDVFVASGALVHPMVVIDAANGPVYLDEDVEVHPFTRIEGPCFVGAKRRSFFGTKCREGNSHRPYLPRRRRGRGVDHPQPLEQVS